ncbi:hypothetical protein GND98_014395 [Clostridium butyricum]|jgi:hypothetical protein|uniref:Calcium-binding protein n=1 Tax=Clostridium butyricum TaxID=1492 RepID=A0A6L9EQY3_CLOBU|nr:hypothetical protein [Clostridium butyricum]
MEWEINSNQDRRIYYVIKDVQEDDYMGAVEAWEKYLMKNLKFPFEAIVAESEVYYPIEYGDKLKVIGIDMIDDLYGVIVNIKKGRHSCCIELCQLETEGENRQVLDDYNTWFCNK